MSRVVSMPRSVPVRSGERQRLAEAQVARLTARLIRRGAIWLALACAFYAAIEVVTYRQTYPDAAARASLAKFSDDPAMRMMQGVPYAVDTPGGFVVWDAGWVLAVMAGIWALLVTSRLLRGEEESARAELVLAAPVRAPRVVLAQFVVLVTACAAVGVVTAAALAGSRTGTVGSVLFGAGLAGVAATFAGITAVAAQLFQARRRATSVSAALLGVFFLIRMAADSADPRGWLRWLTPFGWLEELHPYRDPRWAALAVSLVAPAVLCATAVRLRAGRDTGGAMIAEPDRARARLRLLGGPTGFAWRSTQGMLAGWLSGIAVSAFVSGTLVATVADFVAEDANYRKVLERLGWDAGDAAKGFVGIMGIMIGLLVALYACWRIGAARAEEAAGRLDHVLTRSVTRRRWLGGHVALTVAVSALLALVSACVMWAGVAVTGAPVGFSDILAANLNPLSLVAFFTGLAVFLFGARPRPAVAVAVAAVVTAYLAETIGPALDWPTWVLAASPFHHLASVPVEPFESVAAAVMTALGALLAAAGIVLFDRRDLAGD